MFLGSIAYDGPGAGSLNDREVACPVCRSRRLNARPESRTASAVYCVCNIYHESHYTVSNWHVVALKG